MLPITGPNARAHQRSLVDNIGTGFANQAFAGADVRALIIPKDDQRTIDATVQYLESLQSYLVDNFDETTNLVNLTKAEELNLLNQLPASNGSNEPTLPVLNLQSITVSTFRKKTQVRALGSVNPRGIARGSRTLAGTMILTEFDRDVFWNLLTRNAPLDDHNIGDAGANLLIDQAPAFNMLLLFAHELGGMAYRMLYGIDISAAGIVYSVQDMYHEGTFSFYLDDVTPLTPMIQESRSFRLLATANSGTGAGLRIDPLGTVRSGRELVRQYRLRQNARNTDL